jgi:very-short-patch-repair endonuclease
MPALRDLISIATRQHGVVSSDDLRIAGITRGARRGLLARGELIAVGPDAHRVAGFPTTARQRVLIACVALRGVASHDTSGELHALPTCRFDPIHVLTDRTRSARHLSGLGIAHTTTNLPPDDIISVDGIPCTSVARTIMLLAGAPGASEARVRAVVDHAIRTGQASDAWLWWRLERLRCRGRSGVTLLSGILTARSGGTVAESWLERRFLGLVDDAKLPRPICQARIDHHGSFAGRVDFLFERQRLVVEVLGHAFHATPEQLTADAKRRARLLLAGYRVLEFTYDQIVRSPDDVLAMLTEALDAQPAR